MIKIGRTLLNGTPRVVVSFGDDVTPQTLRSVQKMGIDVIELRIDRYSSFERAHVLSEVGKFRNFSSIATIRSKKEGGRWDLPEEDRRMLFDAVLPHVSAVDIELSSKQILRDVIRSARRLKKPTIVSYHNFSKTPKSAELARMLVDAKSLGADIFKVATMAVSPSDVRELAGFTIAHASQNLITIAMGAEGAVSRVLFPALGSLLTYAHLGRPAAPGQLDYRRISGMFRSLYPNYKNGRI